MKSGFENLSINNELPLVSILIPTHCRPDYAELALRSALSQTYENIEIIVSDNSEDSLTQARFSPYIKQYSHIYYERTPSCSALENFQYCYERSRGEYINYLMDDDLFHPDKIKKMMDVMLRNPSVGLVTSFRQLIDKNGVHLPSVPGAERLFDVDTLIHGLSLGRNILMTAKNPIGEPTTALFRKNDVGNFFGRYRDKKYSVLADCATWLTILSKKDCAYLPEALSYFRIHDGQGQHENAIQIKGGFEWLELISDEYQKGNFLLPKEINCEFLGSLLVSCLSSLLSVRHDFKSGTYDLARIQSVQQQAISILFET